MKAMIFAAGLGKRMRPLTEHTPKPLLKVGGKPLIEHTIIKLRKAGITEIVINIAYLGEQIKSYLKDGSQFGVSIVYSRESEPLDTGGGIYQALELLGSAPFILINSDIWTDFPVEQLIRLPLDKDNLGHLIVVPNPEHNGCGDFCLSANGKVVLHGEEKWTYSGICLLSPSLVSQYPDRRRIFPLREVFCYAMEKDALTGELFEGEWRDIGTPQRLETLNAQLTGRCDDNS